MKMYAMSVFEMVDGTIYCNENRVFTEEPKAVSAMNEVADNWLEMFNEGEDVSEWEDRRLFNEVRITASENESQKPTMLYIVISEVNVEIKQVISVI